MNIIFYSKNSYKQLGSLSNETKQKLYFENLTRNDGVRESILQRNCRLMKKADPNACIVIAAAKNQTAILKAQLGDEIDISIEPCSKDTWPAIALATAYLHDIKQVSIEEVVIFFPIESLVEIDFFSLMYDLPDIIRNDKINKSFVRVDHIYSRETQIDSCVYENTDVYAAKMGYLLSLSDTTLGSSLFDVLLGRYSELPVLSLDNDIIAKESSIESIKYLGKWKTLMPGMI